MTKKKTVALLAFLIIPGFVLGQIDTLLGIFEDDSVLIDIHKGLYLTFGICISYFVKWLDKD